MSFLARPIRPLAAIALRRSFVTTRSALTTGYGRDTGATKGATQSVDPIAGGDVPDYSGPSIKEKKKGSAVDANQEATRLSDTHKADKNINRTGTKAIGNESLNGARPHSNRRYSTMTAWRAPMQGPSEQEVDERIRQQARYKTPGSLTEAATERSNISTELPAGAMSGVTGQSGPANGPSRMSSGTGDLKEAAADLKESASNLYQKAKKGARSIKEKVSDVMGGDVSIPPMSDLHIGEKLSSAGKRVRNKLQDLSQDLGSTPYADTNSDATGLSTGRGAGNMGADGGVAVKSSRSGRDLSEMGSDPIAEDELPGVRLPGSDENARARSSAVPGSIFNGPQDMPQGVGRRAKNELGQAMETGTKDS